jgi:ubiquinone/menaquinone biosynthesis C-methylase UbiE
VPPRQDSPTIGLETAASAANFTRWIYDEIRPFVKGESILEVGCGIGTYSEMLYRDFHGELFLTDVDSEYLSRLSSKFDDSRVTFSD